MPKKKQSSQGQSERGKGGKIGSRNNQNFKKFKNYVMSHDLYAQSIQLYQFGEDSLSTFWGGLMSIFVKLIMTIFLI